MMRNVFITIFMALLSIPAMANGDFVTVSDGKLMHNGSEYYYVGTNFWYGAILGSEGTGGDRQRLCRELDLMKEAGIDNLRILVGADGERGVTSKVEPTLQTSPGVYNDTLLAGLDYLLMEMGKRDMVAVLYLNNSWEWSGGYSFYLKHAGMGNAPIPAVDGYEKYMDFVKQYATCKKAHELFYNHVRFIIGRTNRYTGKRYIDDPVIMSWQIGNEPRAFDKANLEPFVQWLAEASALIRSLDKNHLISVGSEGLWGCEGDMEAYRKICSDKNIDYCNIHIWPYNWNWAKADSLKENLPRACAKTKEYIDMHLEVAGQLGKPVVMEEFGYPRDGFKFTLSTPTTARDAYYKYVFGLIEEDASRGGLFAGCNFWGWGGIARPRHENWQPGDDYCGDPAQEAQGLNSVFISDKSTIKIIKSATGRIKKANTSK